MSPDQYILLDARASLLQPQISLFSDGHHITCNRRDDETLMDQQDSLVTLFSIHFAPTHIGKQSIAAANIMSSNAKVRVFLAVPSEASIASAELVAKELLVRYGIGDVTIRSSSAPVDRLLSVTDESPVSAVWVFWSGSLLATAGLVQEESPFPVLEVDATAAPKEIAWTIAKWCSLGCETVASRVRLATVERRQGKLIEDAQLQSKSWKYLQAIAKCYDNEKQIIGCGIESAIRGKVRDRIDLNDRLLALVTTDRQSGFDRQLALVPYKGAVLNLTSAFWFDQTKHIIPNHVVAIPHPYVTIAKKCQPFPIEFVVRYVCSRYSPYFLSSIY